MNGRIAVPPEAIAEFCRKWRIVEFAVFGSVLREDFRPDSDIDVLVRFAPEAGYTLFDLVHLQDELRGLLGRKVDLVERTAIEQSRNYLRRKAILENAEILYAA